jgi:hypothetical protein
MKPEKSMMIYEIKTGLLQETKQLITAATVAVTPTDTDDIKGVTWKKMTFHQYYKST